MDGSCNECSPPLRIVLGAYNGSPQPVKDDAAAAATVANVLGEMRSSPPATYILGTSYFATPRLSSLPNSSSSSRRSALRLNKDGRVPMEDRKSPFGQFKPKSLVLSTVRVTAINISTTLSNFFSDQLNAEQNIESMVDAGKLTSREADETNEEWENREWQLRIDALPKKVGLALLRFHACTAVMRFYEFIVAGYVLRVDGSSQGEALLVGGSMSASATIHSGGSNNNSTSILSYGQAVTVMDNLTRDPFQASLRTSQILHKQEHTPGKVFSSNGTETSTSRDLAERMFTTCIWANIIPFLAELTVQQGVLIYGYGIYYIAKQKRKKRKEMDGEQNGEGKENQCAEDGGEDEDDISESAYALSLMFQSSRLTFARSMSWVVASAGGAVGSVVYPGWGTVFGNQIGDAMVGALID